MKTSLLLKSKANENILVCQWNSPIAPLGLMQLDGLREKKKDNIVEVDCGQTCSQRHEVTGAYKTLE